MHTVSFIQYLGQKIRLVLCVYLWGSHTEVVGNDIRHIDFAITGLRPHAATRGAGISIPLILIIHSNIVYNFWLINITNCHTQ